MNKSIRSVTALIAVLTTVGLPGCAHVGVKPWEREVLAREDMQLDANALDTAFDDHIYFSKEGTSGGRGFGGGGCGCN
ncbi:MAG TPA: DUF4266 domain-containing protein [Steroidobacteraceae bacterium]|jgi:hypothetical protein